MQSYALKFVLVGDSGVGKTQLLRRFGKKDFLRESLSTMNMEFSTRDIPFERCVIKAQIWDTAGQERFESMTKAYYRDAMGAFLVYDVTDRDSFEHLKEIWLKQLRDFAHEKIQMMLVGNKADSNMTPGARKVTQEEGIAFAKELDMDFTETSAFDGEVEPTFRRCILSVAPVIPDVSIHLDLTGLPNGWIAATPAMVSQATAIDSSKQAKGGGDKGYMTVKDEDTAEEDDQDKYCNYWNGTVSNSKPTEKAESGMLHEAKQRALVSSASFCARTVSSEIPGSEGGFRLQNVKIVDVELEDGDGGSDEEQLTQIEKLKSKCTCTIL